jgi:hypothetical protein
MRLPAHQQAQSPSKSPSLSFADSLDYVGFLSALNRFMHTYYYVLPSDTHAGGGFHALFFDQELIIINSLSSFEVTENLHWYVWQEPAAGV